MPEIPLTKSELADLAAYMAPIWRLYNESTRSRRTVEPMMKARTWYVIADGGRARFIERDENGAFRTVASFVSTELHKRSSDLGRDRPARVIESATPGRSAIEPRRDLKEAAKEDFVKVVAEELGVGHERGQFDGLVLVAPPGVLTELKNSLSKPIASLVIRDLQKDLTKVPDHDLTEHLAD
jgi:protein required for attachment to host cells